MPGAQSIRSKTRDRQIAREAAYKSAANPFAEGTRLRRYYIKARRHFEYMESVMIEMELAYGSMNVEKRS